MYGFGGTTSIQDACTPSQCFRDVHVVARSVTVPYEAIGRGPSPKPRSACLANVRAGCDRFETRGTGTRQWFVRVRRLSALPGGEILEEHGRQAKHVREERVASAGGGEESGVRNQARRLRCPTTSM